MKLSETFAKAISSAKGRAVEAAIHAVPGRDRRERLLIHIARISGIDLMRLAYTEMGVLKFENEDISGEKHFIDIVLREKISTDAPVIFDVGAHVGKYSAQLIRSFPKADVYAFEPNPATFAQLSERFANGEIHCINLGVSSEAGRMEMYVYPDNPTTSHATAYREVITDLNAAQAQRVDVSVTTLDDFCRDQAITRVDFLKIDTEGHELEVLRGATGLLARGGLPVVQFEFNEPNVVSRVFMRDFYTLLDGYTFFRLDTARLVPLGAYDSSVEIFKFQNIVAFAPSPG